MDVVGDVVCCHELPDSAHLTIGMISHDFYPGAIMDTPYG